MPYGRAFIVHFTAESQTSVGRVTGRVEHLKTGGRSWFTSVGGLLASMTKLLGEPPSPGKRRRRTTRGFGPGRGGRRGQA